LKPAVAAPICSAVLTPMLFGESSVYAISCTTQYRASKPAFWYKNKTERMVPRIRRIVQGKAVENKQAAPGSMNKQQQQENTTLTTTLLMKWQGQKQQPRRDPARDLPVPTRRQRRQVETTKKLIL